MADNDLEDEAVFTDQEKAEHRTRQAVVFALFVYAIVALGAIVYLSATGADVPESLIATLALSVGALAGLAAK